MQRIELEVSVRDEQGKGPARRLRAEGSVPLILYGTGVDALPLSVPGMILERILRSGANALINLKGAAEVQGKLVLVKEIQRDPLSQNLVHCDLYAVDTKKKLQIEVPLHIEGKAPGVELGGILNILSHELAVSCLPLAIPDRIVVDVSKLEIGDTLRLSEITLPEGSEAVLEASQVLVTVTAPRVEEEETAEAEEVEGEEGAPAVASAEGDEDKGSGEAQKQEKSD